MQRRVQIVALVLVALALVAPATALAAQSYTDTVKGYEYFATSTDGRFAGKATGDLPGAWNADVRHTALCLSCTPTAHITGGGFSLATALNSVPTVVTGAFAGGRIQVIDPGAGCTNQTFAIRGTLANVGAWSGGSGTGTFRVTLTHYRTPILGACVTYAASVAGTLGLDF